MAAADPFVGRQVGNLVLERRLGAGGMGMVFQARHRVLETPWAVKVLHPRLSSQPAIVERFRQEAMACSRLRHENVVFVTDFGLDDAIGLYLVMEYLAGMPLDTTLSAGGGMPVGRMVRIAQQLCDAMSCAHRMGIVHRDLKPENVLLTDDSMGRDRVKVIDFGLATLRDVPGAEVEETLGTPAYMAPEQILGEEIGAATDIYALGLLFYALLAGAPPFSGDEETVLTAQVRTRAPPVSARRPELAGTAIEELIRQMLSKRPLRRPSDLETVRARLGSALDELVDAAMPGIEWPTVSAIEPLDFLDDTPTVDLDEIITGERSPIHVTTLVLGLRRVTTGSATVRLLDALREASWTLDSDIVCLALWGVLQQELREAVPRTAEWDLAVDQAVLLLQSILGPADEAPPQAPDRALEAFTAGLSTLTPDRRDRVLSALYPLSKHPHFPPDLLQEEHTGSWLPRRALVRRNTTPDQLARMSLVQKFQQDVSFATLGAVLSHEVHVFGSPSRDASSLREKLTRDVSISTIGSVLNHRIRLFGGAEDGE